MQRCLTDYQHDESFPVHADCRTRLITVIDQTYQLHPRPVTFPSDGHIDPDRKWLWQDVATDEWLDGTTPSHEPQADTAFDALCPGRRPDADHGLVLRDPAAQFPSSIQGTWTPDAATCTRAQRAEGGEVVAGALTILTNEVQSHENLDELNQIRRLDARGWTADVSRTGGGDGGQTSVSYRQLGEALLVSDDKATRRLVRCPP